MAKHKVTKRESLEAIRYFHEEGFIEDLRRDSRYYVTILLKEVANKHNIELVGIDDEDI